MSLLTLLGRKKVAPSYSDEALALFARFQNDPPPVFKAAYDAFLTHEGVLDILAKLDGFYCGAAHDLQGTTVNWIADQYNLTLNGTFEHIPGWHLKGNGSNAWAATGANMQSLTNTVQNSATMLAYFPEPAAGGNIIGTEGSGDRFRLAVGPTNIGLRLMDATTMLPNHGSNGKGLFAGVRSASNAKRTVMNGTNVSTATTASSAPINENIALFRNSTAYSASGAAFVGFGAALTNEELQTLQVAMEAYLAIAEPRVFVIPGSGQSNYRRLHDHTTNLGSGTGVAGSDVLTHTMLPLIQTHLDAQYNDGRVNRIIAPLSDTMVGGTRLLRGDDATAQHPNNESWWDNTENLPDGQPAQLATTFATKMQELANRIDPSKWTKVCILFTHEGQGSPANGVFPATLSAWKEAFGKLTDYYFADVFDRDDITVIIRANGGDGTADNRQRAFRRLQGETAAEYDFAILSNETTDLQRVNANDVHPVPRATSDFGYELDGKRLSPLIAAKGFGCAGLVCRGPEIASASAVNSTTIDVTIAYGPDCGGTDFTPDSGIVGFEVTDSGGTKTISSAVRQDASTIRLTLADALASGTVSVRYEPIAGALDRTKMVVDNYGPTFPLAHGVVTFEHP